MAQLTIQALASAGLNPALVAASAGGDEFADDGLAKTFMEVNNAGGGSINATIVVQKVGPYRIAGVGSVVAASIVVAVTNGQRRLIGPFTQAYISPSTGRVSVTYSGVTSVTVGAFKISKED